MDEHASFSTAKHLHAYGLTRKNAAWLMLAVALLACYASTLRGMGLQWVNDEDMGHGLLVPLVALWIVWRERKQWEVMSPTPGIWGYSFLLLGATFHIAGSLGVGLFASSLGFLFSIFGLVVLIGGFSLVRAWIFPLLLLVFMLPKLAIVYNQATLPLQILASKLAAGILATSGSAVVREGNILDVNGHRVAVEEACSGIRYLLPLGFLSLVFAYVVDPRVWMRAVLLVASVPLAIVGNALRVAASARFPAFDGGALHQVLGWTIFTMTLAALIPTRRLCNSLMSKYAW